MTRRPPARATRKKTKAAPRPPAPARQRLPREARRQQIVERSIEVFAERGLTGTTSAALAQACGVSEALLFRLFGDKRGLYAAIVQRVVERGDDVFPRDAAADDDDLAFFRRLARYVLDRADADPAFLRLLLHSALEGHELLGLFQQARGVKVVGFVAERVRRRVAEGAFRPVEPELVARGFLGMVHNVAMTRHVYRLPGAPGADDNERVALEFAGLFVRGLRR